jgi:hypothetical protein
MQNLEIFDVILQLIVLTLKTSWYPSSNVGVCCFYFIVDSSSKNTLFVHRITSSFTFHNIIDLLVAHIRFDYHLYLCLSLYFVFNIYLVFVQFIPFFEFACLLFEQFPYCRSFVRLALVLVESMSARSFFDRR